MHTTEKKRRHLQHKKQAFDSDIQALQEQKVSLEKREEALRSATQRPRTDRRLFQGRKQASEFNEDPSQIDDLLEKATYDEVVTALHLTLNQLAVEDSPGARLDVVFRHVIQPQSCSESASFATYKLLNEHLIKPAFAETKSRQSASNLLEPRRFPARRSTKEQFVQGQPASRRDTDVMEIGD